MVYMNGKHDKSEYESEEKEKVLKVRLMGTKNDIKWFEEILKKHPKVDVVEFSELYQNKGTNKYYRVYVEVHNKIKT